MTLTSTEAEIFIGIAARLGVDTKAVVDAARKLLKEYDYQVVEIKVTDAVTEFEHYADLDLSSTEKRYGNLIEACDKIRERTKCREIMAQLAVSKVLYERINIGSKDNRNKRVAFIINQLKRPEESDLLRSLYGEHYIQIACHAKESIRLANLTRKISNDNPRKPKGGDWALSARALMQKDEIEEDNKWGQRLRDVFPGSDVVIEAADKKSVIKALDRFFRALFGDFRVTPTPDEYGMQLARTASLRSADLSRQVGAAIINRFNEIQALGCNEVPRFGGGTYWEGDAGDQREFQLERDSNDERKREVLHDLISRLIEINVIPQQGNDPTKIYNDLLSRDDKIILDSQMMDSLEYGRSIHAEMNAITDAARGGHSLRNCKLYCNTFPCHNCAKHIVAAGITEVIYNLPYPKSYAEDLFSDSIAVDPDDPVTGRVIFRQFIGIMGPIFGRVFEKRKWKASDGSVPAFNKREAAFIRKSPGPAYAEAEAILVVDLTSILKNAGLKVRNADGGAQVAGPMS